MQALASWPDAVAGKRVRVTGTVEWINIPSAVTSDAGLHRAGLEGNHWFLRKPQWEALPD